MSFDYELEGIIDSVNERKGGGNGETPEASKPIEPPKTSLEEQLKAVRERSEIPDALAEPEIKIEEPALTPEKKAEPKKGIKTARTKSAPVDRTVEKLKDDKLKKAITVVLVLIVAVGLAFGGVKIARYAKTAYIKQYEKQFNVDFPDGILKEMCEDYGEDQSFAGRLSIEGAASENVYSKYRVGKPLLEKGSNIYKDQHIRAISLDSREPDLEKLYSSAESFLASSQEVEFDTLFAKEKYQVVAAYYTNTKPEDDNGYVFPYNTYATLTKSSFYQYQDRIKARRLYDTGYKLLEQNYILSISAPSDFMKDFRFVIVCVKAEDGFEKIKKAEPNPKIYYPQVWFDKNNQKNPYYLTGKWYPEIIVSSDGKTKQLTEKDFEY